MSLGLLQWKPDSELVAEEQAVEQAMQQEKLQKQLTLESSLAGHIKKCWESAKQARVDVDKRLLNCLRRYKGEYTDEKLSAIRQTGGSEVFIKLTTTKCRALESWVRDILIPNDEWPFGLSPTPIAEIPEPIKAALMQMAYAQAQQMMQEGEEVDQEALLEDVMEKAKAEAQKLAEKAADHMELKIQDQLTEGGWIEALESFIHDFAIFPVAILKGPILRRRKTLAWQDGWKPIQVDEVRPEMERISPFDFYPSSDAVDIDDASFVIERSRFTRATLNTLRGVDGYETDAIDQVLTDYGQGGLKDWIWGDSERARLEDKQSEWLTSGDTIDGLYFWGGVQGLTLLQWGMTPDEIEDPLAEYQVEAILIGNHCIRCILHNDPMHRRPYHKASFQNVAGSFWGMAIPELMDDIQDICNATGRAIVDNLAMSSGPQIDVAMDRLAPGEDPEDVYPRKVWRTLSDRHGTGNTKAVNFFQPDSNAAELMGVFEKFEVKADDATNIPRYIYGNEKIGGAGNTASGLSMLMESANKGIKSAVGHIDSGVIRRVAEALWLHNMMYSNDNSLKGDVKVVAKGSNAMLQRERTAIEQRELFQQVANPELVQRMLGVRGQAELLRAVTRNIGIRDLVPDAIEDEIEQEGQEKTPEQELALAEIEAKVAKLQAEAQRIQAQAEEAQAKAGHEPVKAEKTLAEIEAILASIRGLIGPATNQSGVRGVGQTPQGQPARMAGANQMAGASEKFRLGLSGPSQRPGGNPQGAGQGATYQ